MDNQKNMIMGSSDWIVPSAMNPVFSAFEHILILTSLHF